MYSDLELSSKATTPSLETPVLLEGVGTALVSLALERERMNKH